MVNIGLLFLLLLVVPLATVAMLMLYIIWDDVQTIRAERQARTPKEKQKYTRRAPRC